MACPALWNATSDESFHSDLLFEINSLYSTKESKNKNAVCIFCNGKLSEDERAEIWIKCFSFPLCAHLWTVPQQRTQNISATFINRIEAEMSFA